MKVLTVIGARPQFIKASVVSDEIARRGTIEETVVHTGQHFDANMSSVFFSELGMAEPRHHLDIHGGHHGEMTARMLQGIEHILIESPPDVLMVYGDTNSTLAGALAAIKLHIPVAHVEAGLRSFNMQMPEEVNRILTDRVSTWLFAPTAVAVSHLRREGMDAVRIHEVGDVMYDVALRHGERASALKAHRLEEWDLSPKRYVLATVHRAENTDDPRRLRAIGEAFVRVAGEMPVLWPLHPRTRAALARAGLLGSFGEKIKIVEPLGYLDMVAAERNAAVIATDSGGVQKEAFFHQVPCVTLRDETEWVELVDAGWNRLVAPADPGLVAGTILASVNHLGERIQPYGDGRAARKIVDCLEAG